MKIIIDRNYRQPGYTIGDTYVNGTYFASSMEDEDRGLHTGMSLKEIMSIKVKGETAIPKGTYDVTYTYSPKFRRYLPLVNDVPGYSGIRIHLLANSKQSEGCIGFGIWSGGNHISESKFYTERLITMIKEALSNGQKVTLEIH